MEDKKENKTEKEEVIKDENNQALNKTEDDELAQSFLEVRGTIQRMGRRRDAWTKYR